MSAVDTIDRAGTALRCMQAATAGPVLGTGLWWWYGCGELVREVGTEAAAAAAVELAERAGVDPAAAAQTVREVSATIDRATQRAQTAAIVGGVTIVLGAGLAYLTARRVF